MYTTLELEAAVVSANEELSRKENELMYLKSLLTNTIKERNEAQENCQRLILEKHILQQKLQPSPLTINVFEDELTMKGESATGFSYSGCDENSTPSPRTEQILPPPPPVQPVDVAGKLVINKTLPENGKFLKAVMEAGPLLQTVLLAGPLPQWQHPPPQLNSGEIPPVTIPSPGARVLIHQDSCLSTSGCFSKKRGLVQRENNFDFSPNSKNQKVGHQSSLTNIQYSPIIS